MARRDNPEINAGSMADIAFLLLIFFLVTTTMEKDEAIPMTLAKKDNTRKPVEVNKRNILEIYIGIDKRILLENERIIKVDKLREEVVAFLDNGGSTGNPLPGEKQGTMCSYCSVKTPNPNYSDHPNKAIVALSYDRKVDYNSYIKVRVEILKAYRQLRDKLALSKFKVTFEELETALEALQEDSKEYLELKKRVDYVKKRYPLILTDVQPNN